MNNFEEIFLAFTLSTNKRKDKMQSRKRRNKITLWKGMNTTCSTTTTKEYKNSRMKQIHRMRLYKETSSTKNKTGLKLNVSQCHFKK